MTPAPKRGRCRLRQMPWLRGKSIQFTGEEPEVEKDGKRKRTAPCAGAAPARDQREVMDAQCNDGGHRLLVLGPQPTFFDVSATWPARHDMPRAARMDCGVWALPPDSFR